jgi:hypothetical protein
MALPSHISKKLRQTLGPDAGGDFVTWLDEMRAEHERSLAAMQAEFAAMRALITAFERRSDERFADLKVNIAEVKAELMKWSFVFWVGAVLAVAALAGVLRQ